MSIRWDKIGELSAITERAKMGKLTKETFNESCCDGGALSGAQSAQPCGCDTGAKHLCERHSNPTYKYPALKAETYPLPTMPITYWDIETDVPHTDAQRNPALEKVLGKMREMHARKNHDYASDSNQFSNFEEAAAFAGCPVEMVFRVMIGIKIARLKELQSSGKRPNNESLEDSQFDLMMYCALQRAYKER